MKKLNILVFIDVDVVVRHFIYSSAFAHTAKKHNVKFVFPEQGNKRFGSIIPDALSLPAPYIRLPHHQERTRLWKQIFHIDQLRLRPGKQAAALRRLRRVTLGWKAAALYTLLAMPGIWSIFRAFRLNQIAGLRNTAMEDLFDHE
ncbi:MAG: hypothetical protein JXQ84_09470, partial [Rhodospirillaceae bacterium]|nr:hypothetical protein [Rhodospirillaceae bacterium]